MKAIKLLTLAALCSSLSSCALVKSSLKLPGSVLQTAGRTFGLVNHEEAPKTEAQKQEEEEQKLY